MDARGRFRFESLRMALCGMTAAVAVLILSLGSLVPLATFVCPVLAMLCLLPALCRYGAGTALLPYGAAAILGLLLCPDKEVALLFAFLGWYPCARARLASLPRWLRPIVKCAVFTVSILAMYALILHVFRLEAVSAEFAAYTRALKTALLLLGNATFLLLDQSLSRLETLYRRRRSKRAF